MTQDEIIDKFLYESGAHFGGEGINYEEFDFRKFAALVEEKTTAKEREACAKLCESLPMQQEIDVRDQCAAAIRARGQA